LDGGVDAPADMSRRRWHASIEIGIGSVFEQQFEHLELFVLRRQLQCYRAFDGDGVFRLLNDKPLLAAGHRCRLVVCLILKMFVAAVHAVVGASTPEPRTAEKPGFSTGKIR